MPNEKNYLDDLPGVSGYAFGKFNLDDLDFADDPLKRKIDFIDDALLAPPKPNADITSGIRTSREVMGERKPQPTDAVGMRPEDYIRRRTAHVHEEHHEEPREVRREERKPSVYTYEPAQPARSAGRTAAQSRTRPSGNRLEEAYARYKERKRLDMQESAQKNFTGAVPNRFNAAGRSGSPASVNRRKLGVFGLAMVIFVMVIIIQVFGFMMNIVSDITTHEPGQGASGFAGQTEAGSDEELEKQWMAIQIKFIAVCKETDRAQDLIGSTVYDIGITDEMCEYLLDNADKVHEEDDCMIYETKVADYDIDYYEYDDYAWLRFWSNDYEDVADIAFYYDDMVIQVVDVNGERVAELE